MTNLSIVYIVNIHPKITRNNKDGSRTRGVTMAKPRPKFVTNHLIRMKNFSQRGNRRSKGESKGDNMRNPRTDKKVSIVLREVQIELGILNLMGIRKME